MERGAPRPGSGAFPRGTETKIHLVADAQGQPRRFSLTGGQAHDAPPAIPLLTNVKATHVIADKGYDSDQILDFIPGQGAVAVIPPKSNRKTQREYHRELYKQRNLIEGAFNKLKHWRRIATRYDRKSIYFLSALYLASAVTWSVYYSERFIGDTGVTFPSYEANSDGNRVSPIKRSH